MKVAEIASMNSPSAVRGERIQVRARVFGRLDEQPLAAIWNQPDSIAFRREAALNDYAPCWSCTAAPCADLVNTNLTWRAADNQYDVVLGVTNLTDEYYIGDDMSSQEAGNAGAPRSVFVRARLSL